MQLPVHLRVILERHLRSLVVLALRALVGLYRPALGAEESVQDRLRDRGCDDVEISSLPGARPQHTEHQGSSYDSSASVEDFDKRGDVGKVGKERSADACRRNFGEIRAEFGDGMRKVENVRKAKMGGDELERD